MAKSKLSTNKAENISLMQQINLRIKSTQNSSRHLLTENEQFSYFVNFKYVGTYKIQ